MLQNLITVLQLLLYGRLCSYRYQLWLLLIKKQTRESSESANLCQSQNFMGSIFMVSASASRSHLRSAARGDLAVPRSRTTTYGQRSFSVSGPSLWNSLPLSVRDPPLTMTQFCTHLKTFPFRRAYCTQHSAFVTVQAVNSCADINLLTYLLMGKETYGTPLLAATTANINFTGGGGGNFSQENIAYLVV